MAQRHKIEDTNFEERKEILTKRKVAGERLRKQTDKRRSMRRAVWIQRRTKD